MEERKKRLEEERLAKERAEKRKLERRCPECDQKVGKHVLPRKPSILLFHHLIISISGKNNTFSEIRGKI